LTKLTEGEHDFSVTARYVVDFSSRNVTQLKGSPKPIHVTIDAEPEPQQTEPFPTSLVIAASGVSIIVIVVGLLVYVKKRKNSVVYKRRGYYIIDDLEAIFGVEKGMLTHKNRHNETVFMTFNCRLCKVCFSNPYELRMHSMVQHKGHMLLSIKR